MFMYSSFKNNQFIYFSDEATKKILVNKRLWENVNLEDYLAEMRKESKHRR